LGRLQKETPEEIEEIEQVLAEIAEEQPVVRITVRENGEFTNVYLDKLMDESELELEEDEETEDENEEEETEEEETEDEGETEEDEDENEEEEEGDVSYEDIMEMKQKDLISLIKENKLKTKTNMPINTMRKKVCEELGLEPSEEETEEETEEVEEEVEIKKGSKVIFLHKGKTTEAKVLSIDGDTLKVKTKDGTVIKVPAAKCEADDTPF
jgi:flagellar biosynthesis component FlhA